MSGKIDRELLRALDPAVDGWLDWRAEAGSSNDEAQLAAARGAAHGAVVWVSRQTAGRGRRGAVWFSGPESLAFSVVLRPLAPRVLWPRLALVAGLAVAETLERYGVPAEVKWPNDVLSRGRKLCGVLAEAGADHVVMGMGINVNESEFPAELAGLATSLRLECGHPVSREEVLVETRARLLFLAAEAANDFAGILASIEERCALRGRRVTMETGGGRLQGVVLGLAADGALRLETASGVLAVVQADAVRVAEEGR